MKVLVVGGAGYIGGHLVDLLWAGERFGFEVSVYDILAYEERFLKDVPFIYGDVRDREKLSKILPEFDVVVWLAAIVGDGACVHDPFLTQAVNEDSVKWLVDNYGGHIIFTSTCSVYGVNNDLIDEDAAPNPLSIYGETKLAAERYVLRNAPNRSTVFRLGTLHGIGDQHSRIRLDLVSNILAKRAACGEKLRIFGGEQWRPLIHVKDVGRAIAYVIGEMALGEMALEGRTLTGLYNLATGNYRISDIGDTIRAEIPECEIETVDMLFEDLRNYRVKTDRWMVHGWVPKYNLNDGIREIIQIVKDDRIKHLGSPIYSNDAYIGDQYRRWL